MKNIAYIDAFFNPNACYLQLKFRIERNKFIT